MGKASIVWAQRGHLPGSLHKVCVGGWGGVVTSPPPPPPSRPYQTPGALLSALTLGVGFAEKEGQKGAIMTDRTGG